MNLLDTCLEGCQPSQIVNINFAFNDLNNIEIIGKCDEYYDKTKLEYAYSIDSLCWSCYMSYDDFLTNTIELKNDFYIRVRVRGEVKGIMINGQKFYDYTVSIESGFTFSYCSNSTMTNTNLFNPYSNMECAMNLYQTLTESINCIVGVPCYYFKLSPEAGSKDLTFKEYALLNVESVKQIKLIIADNQMPSSKPEFNDWGLDWQTDWEVDIAKGMFATAFGNTAQPMEGDLVYIPLMKRMWMVNEAYEEKKDAFMWNASTFKVTLVKYQEKDSVDLKDTEQLVNSFVKNKYEDLFGDEENIGSGQESTDPPAYNPDTLYPVFTQDATRKYISVDAIDFKQGLLYYKGSMIADDVYTFNGYLNGTIVYQRKYCGEDGTFSFIITPTNDIHNGTLLKIGHLKINIKQNKNQTTLTMVNVPNMKLTLNPGKTYFVYFRFSRQLNVAEFFAAEYVHADLPLYRLQNHHYWFDIDNGQRKSAKYDIELVEENKSEIIIYSFYGSITNIKVFDIYVDDVSEILQMYPTNSNLLVNDTARKVVDMQGLTRS